MINRRFFCGSLVAAPAVLRLGLWMPIKAFQELNSPSVMWGYELYQRVGAEWAGSLAVWRPAVYEKLPSGWRRTWVPSPSPSWSEEAHVDIVAQAGDGFVGTSKGLAQAT